MRCMLRRNGARSGVSESDADPTPGNTYDIQPISPSTEFEFLRSTVVGCVYSEEFIFFFLDFAQRARAAFLASSLRSSGLNFSVRALPPNLPR